MDYEKIHKILMEIISDQYEVIIESTLRKKEGNYERESYREQDKDLSKV